ncbi:MAG: NADH dehydrogenase subunit I [Syntrophaceae bacterium PtaU1.Bin231]|nr:MAG: NADH dehydrogenase subunit I [Syntrophaceae bacterium PtaU1.Bin231]HOG17484.1 4Fe-4S binding protein [Syntrophales bacterium]
MKGRIEINRERCKECHLCIAACKQRCITPSPEYNTMGYRPVSPGDSRDCTGCTLCAVVCPEVAIEVYREE